MLRYVFYTAAVVCFAIALLLSLGTFNGGNQEAWTLGGFLALALGFLAALDWPPPRPRP